MVSLGSLHAFSVVGFAYGAIIAVYPAAVTAHYGAARSARVYGRVFTAWGLAGLAGPWLAGALYDLSGTYSVALGLAALAGVVSACFAFALPSLPGVPTKVVWVRRPLRGICSLPLPE